MRGQHNPIIRRLPRLHDVSEHDMFGRHVFNSLKFRINPSPPLQGLSRSIEVEDFLEFADYADNIKVRPRSSWFITNMNNSELPIILNSFLGDQIVDIITEFEGRAYLASIGSIFLKSRNYHTSTPQSPTLVIFISNEIDHYPFQTIHPFRTRYFYAPRAMGVDQDERGHLDVANKLKRLVPENIRKASALIRELECLEGA